MFLMSIWFKCTLCLIECASVCASVCVPVYICVIAKNAKSNRSRNMKSEDVEVYEAPTSSILGIVGSRSRSQ